MPVANERQPLSFEMEVEMAAVAVGTSTTIVGGRVPAELGAGYLAAASYAPTANIVGANTNYRAIIVTNRGQDGNSNIEMARIDFTAGITADDFDERILTLNATLANRNVQPGDIISVSSNAVGTGIADPGGLLRLSFARGTIS